MEESNTDMKYHNIPHIDMFDTGDILLFSGSGIFPSKIIEFMTDSDISHIGIVLKNPCIFGKQYEGYYIFESTAFIDAKNVESGKYTSGVQINELSKVFDTTNGSIFWRKLNVDRNKDFNEIMEQSYRLTKGASYDYDPEDWIKAFFDIHTGDEEKNTEYICSALASFLYDRLGLLQKPVDWTIVRPVDWVTVSDQNNNNSRIHLTNSSLDKPLKVKDDKNNDKNNNDKNNTYYDIFTGYVKSIYKFIFRA